MAEDRKPSHTVADHLLGQDVVHEHDGDADHDHDHFEFESDERLEENPIWIQDHVTLVTVGMDIGSSGTQGIFSRINLRCYGEDLTSRYYVVSRETLFQSPVALTPYSSDERIDDAALGAIIDEAYAAAGIEARDIDTGVVILTGEALRRENAEAIAALLASKAAISSPPPPGTTWNRCWRPTVRAHRSCRTIRASASSTSTSAAAPPSSVSSRTAT